MLDTENSPLVRAHAMNSFDDIIQEAYNFEAFEIEEDSLSFRPDHAIVREYWNGLAYPSLSTSDHKDFQRSSWRLALLLMPLFFMFSYMGYYTGNFHRVEEAKTSLSELAAVELLHSLKSSEYTTKINALKSILPQHLTTNPSVLNEISLLTQDSDYLVRAYALKVMGKLNPELAIEVLRKRLTEEQHPTVLKVISSLLSSSEVVKD